MKKNSILIILIFIFITIFGLPNINYNKIEYVSYSMNQSFSTDWEFCALYPNCVTIQLQLNYEPFDSDSDDRMENLEVPDSKDSDTIRTIARTEGKEYHEGKNKDIIPLIELTLYQEIYLSKYTPFIDITYDLEYYMKHQDYILQLFTNSELVKYVSVKEGYQDYDSYLDWACRRTDSYDVYENRTRTGDGVIVGILEPGVIDTSHPDLQNTNIIIKYNIMNALNKDDHTTEMALIIAGENGLAPDATILNACTYGLSANDEIEWMLDNNVDIINMSFGDATNLGTYNSFSAYVDYIMSEYYVLVVAAAGNYGETHCLIDNPGLAYNAITVSSAACDNSLNDYSSYKVNNGPIKPTIGMYGDITLFDPDDTIIHGTSAAAAVTTGLITLILEYYSNLVVNRERLYALMAANAINPYEGITLKDNGFCNTFGAGIFNYGNMIDNMSYSGMTYSSGTVAINQAVYTKTVYVQSGKTIRAAMATIADSDGTVSGINFTDYDLFIYDPENRLVACANSIDSTIELIEYKTTTSGTYTIKITQASNRIKNKDYIGYAYRIY